MESHYSGVAIVRFEAERMPPRYHFLSGILQAPINVLTCCDRNLSFRRRARYV